MDQAFAGFPDDAIDFWKRLEKNNTREWFQAHKDVYERACREPLKALVAELEPRYGPARISRINRDMRFSRDRGPYKTYIAAGIGGRYISLSKAGVWVGAGMYKPDPRTLARLRAAIADDDSGKPLARLVASLRRSGYEVASHDTVASAPRGYSQDHPRIDLLRLKDLYAGKDFPPATWLSTRAALDRIAAVIDDVAPLVEWLREHVGPAERRLRTSRARRRNEPSL